VKDELTFIGASLADKRLRTCAMMLLVVRDFCREATIKKAVPGMDRRRHCGGARDKRTAVVARLRLIAQSHQ
jgi:hypothetical protein